MIGDMGFREREREGERERNETEMSQKNDILL